MVISTRFNQKIGLLFRRSDAQFSAQIFARHMGVSTRKPSTSQLEIKAFVMASADLQDSTKRRVVAGKIIYKWYHNGVI
jgi:hypothetical protein